MTNPRWTRAWRALREQVYREETHCWRCGGWVDQTLPRTDPMARQADHLDPVGAGGAEIPDRSRVRLSHRVCNQTGRYVPPEERGSEIVRTPGRAADVRCWCGELNHPVHIDVEWIDRFPCRMTPCRCGRCAYLPAA